MQHNHLVLQNQWSFNYLFFRAFVIFLGAGGLVINEKNQVLAVCEKYRRKQHWKLPGGMVDRGLYKLSECY